MVLKTQPRFKDIAALRSFIETEYPYRWFDETCECATKHEAVWTLLAFEVTTPTSKHSLLLII